MRLQLKKLRNLFIEEDVIPRAGDGEKILDVIHCAVCRTDAKMWNEGHRDLIFPRVLGHEIVAEDHNRRRYVVWPGKSCGKCANCRNGRENLCDEIKVMGFHHDGGFADAIVAAEENLIPVPVDLPDLAACFAEPVGCALSAIENLRLKKHERLIIFGGGTLGLITALASQVKGAVPLVIEKDERKISHAVGFLNFTGIRCIKETNDADFDCMVNACSDPIAFCQGVAKLKKGGRLSFFSGLKKNENLETNLINLLHYKELNLFGTYGPTRQNMRDALPILDRYQKAFEYLIEEIVLPEQVEDLMPNVLSGKPFRYVIDFSGRHPTIAKNSSLSHVEADSAGESRIMEKIESAIKAYGSDLVQSTIKSISPCSSKILPAAQYKMDNKTKPLGSLGKLEDIAIRLSLIQNTTTPKIDKKLMMIFAADHGVTEEGVSAYPSEVTRQMIDNFLEGGAAITVMCRRFQIDFKVVDMGVNGELKNHPVIMDKKIRLGTSNFALEPAMTSEEACRAIENGISAFMEEYNRNPMDVVGLGEIGIGNTTSAAAIISAVTGVSPAEAAGRGTGLDDKGLEHKIEVIANALQFHTPNSRDGMDILTKIGGFEIAGIVGAILAAASKQVSIVLDGVISTASGLIAYLINPDIQGFLFSGHKSVEPGQAAALKHLEIKPTLDLEMRLGEGTGAAMTIDIMDTACSLMREMASFDDAGVSKSK